MKVHLEMEVRNETPKDFLESDIRMKGLALDNREVVHRVGEFVKHLELRPCSIKLNRFTQRYEGLTKRLNP